MGCCPIHESLNKANWTFKFIRAFESKEYKEAAERLLTTSSSFELQEASCQDGGVGRYTLPPRTTKRRIITNLKTKNNQNCQKIKLYGGLTTKELKKKHLSSLVGGVEKGRWDEKDAGKVGAGGLGRQGSG